MKLILALILCVAFIPTRAQKVDSIFFHLYTDSLKKGTYNYINVDGKMSNGRWMPLSGQELIFWSDAGHFENNCLVLERDFRPRAVRVRTTLRADTSVTKEMLIYVKQVPDPERLPGVDEVMESKRRRRG